MTNDKVQNPNKKKGGKKRSGGVYLRLGLKERGQALLLGRSGKMKRVRRNSQVRKAFQGRSPGFTLIEVVIAVAILGTIAVAFLSGLSTASLSLILADERATAESLARSQMEFAKNQQYESAPDGDVATYPKITGIPEGYSICSVNRNGQTVNCGANDDVIGIPWDSGNNTAEYQDKGLQKIKLVIKRNDEAVITLEGYKRG